MKILHLTVHLGGGLGTVILDWMDKIIVANDHSHEIICLDYVNFKAMQWADEKGFPLGGNMIKEKDYVLRRIAEADIVLCHYYDHKLLADLFADPIPDCRLIFWVHKNFPMSEKEICFPDKCIGTSLVQFLPDYIWSTGNMERFLAIKPKKHTRFNVGYIGEVSYQGKMHHNIFDLCDAIDIPDVHFTFVGENKTAMTSGDKYTFTGKIDDVAPYLATFDILGYPLRQGHWGTCEQVLGEAMSAGVVPVVMDNPAERITIKDNINGYISNSEQEYIEDIVFLSRRPERVKKLSANARIRAKELYNIDRMIQQWNMIFEDMMKQPKKERRTL